MPLLQAHPDIGYNLVNSPHLRPAWLIDRLIVEFEDEVAADKYSAEGLPALISTREHINVNYFESNL